MPEMAGACQICFWWAQRLSTGWTRLSTFSGQSCITCSQPQPPLHPFRFRIPTVYPAACPTLVQLVVLLLCSFTLVLGKQFKSELMTTRLSLCFFDWLKTVCD
uniref:Uncharacterized protein n=1 Tax=Eutreptiella gymnastica TaxID=73025 RepID=A0A7S1ITV5_9EUGL|mmetsp:Transcript_4292/g.7520  ORF Transcript_4292/g.7520 Transcript_4292/m.7520 type:complete len:103 (+) Transcript_4292:537-845(+)